MTKALKTRSGPPWRPLADSKPEGLVESGRKFVSQHNYMENCHRAIDIVDLPNENGDFPELVMLND